MPMLKILLTMRLVAEGVVGLALLLTLPGSILNALTNHGGTPYQLGLLFGMVVMVCVSVWFLVDAVRVLKRLRTSRSDATS